MKIKMKKIILSSLITTSLITTMLLFSGKANAGVTIATGAVVGTMLGALFLTSGGSVTGAIVGTGATAVVAASAVLSPIVVVPLINEFKETIEPTMGFLTEFAALGLIFLDENRQVVEFKSIDPAHASNYGLTETELDVYYNSKLAIINVVLDDFSKLLHNNEVITQEEAIDAYEQLVIEAGLSEECKRVLSRIVIHQFTRVQK